MAAHQLFDRVFVVVGQDDDFGGRMGRDAAGGRHRVGGVGGARLLHGRRDAHFDYVVAAVVAAFEFGDLGPTAEAPRQPDGVQGGLSAGVAEADAFHRRHTAAYLFCQRGLVAGRRAQCDPSSELRLHSLIDRGVIVAQNLAGVVVGKVDTPPLIDIIEITALPALHGQGVGSVIVGALCAARHRFTILLELLLRAWTFSGVCRLDCG